MCFSLLDEFLFCIIEHKEFTFKKHYIWFDIQQLFLFIYLVNMEKGLSQVEDTYWFTTIKCTLRYVRLFLFSLYKLWVYILNH